jgi:serine/threonine protein kinase
MSPEYVMRGQYSTKSDVFSFGILVIEIITGQRNSGHFFCQQNKDIVSIVSIRPENIVLYYLNIWRVIYCFNLLLIEYLELMLGMETLV